MDANLAAALRAALLLLPGRFTEHELYCAIAGLSYAGDPRMVIGENVNKVHNIVAKQLPQFRALYAPLLGEAGVAVEGDAWLTQETGAEVRAGLYAAVPTGVRAAVGQAVGPPTGPELLKGIAAVVRPASSAQTVAGLLSAGPSKAVVYAGQKLRKWAASLRG